MNKSLLDTDFLSEIVKGVDRRVAAIAATYRAAFDRYSISTMTVMEIVKGLHRLNRDDRIRSFLAAMAGEEVVDFDTASAERPA